ncbi:MAG: LacI family DNA-binding transcriptional regulator [Caldilineaceae bacterium]|nr:LacI family DNA-binding transcriptional regulator [Caldilineaceae bacterium]
MGSSANGKGKENKASRQIQTIADLAVLAGVSPSTVSRALNDSPLINVETRARIQALAQEHNFQLHLGAQSLRRQRTKTLGVVVNSERPPGRTMSDPFLLEFLGEIASAAMQRGHDILLADAQTAPHDWCAHFLRGGRADGIIAIARFSERERQAARLAAAGAPFVAWGPALPSQPYCSVGSDDLQGGRQAVEHLICLGRERIAFLGAGSDCLEIQQRYEGYSAALAAAGRTVEPRYVAYAQSTGQAGYEAMRRLLVQAPDLDAIFVSSDVMAIGAIEALRGTGRTVPGDVAVVGYDDIALAAYVSPPLTTVRQRLGEAARLLVERLLAIVEGQPAPSVMLPTELIVRQSCGALSR